MCETGKEADIETQPLFTQKEALDAHSGGLCGSLNGQGDDGEREREKESVTCTQTGLLSQQLVISLSSCIYASDSRAKSVFCNQKIPTDTTNIQFSHSRTLLVNGLQIICSVTPTVNICRGVLHITYSVLPYWWRYLCRAKPWAASSAKGMLECFYSILNNTAKGVVFLDIVLKV